jgi:hypothetical protein
MDRELLAQRLAQAEENIALAFEVIAQQRDVVAVLEAWGQDATAVRRMLGTFEEMHAGFSDDLEAATVQLAAENERRRLKL